MNVLQHCNAKPVLCGGSGGSQKPLSTHRCPSAVFKSPSSSLNQRSKGHARQSQRQVVRCVAEPEVSGSPKAVEESEGFVSVLTPEELPKGVRKEVKVDGLNILIFWYRNQIYAIEGRSPAEGAYSEGFIRAKFTQDSCIECPATKSLFSLNTGEIVSWYPNNPVLRVLTPQDTCRNLQIYPVRLTANAIQVDVSGASGAAATRGGADTSLENNNVYGLEPKVYLEGSGLPVGADTTTVTETPAKPGMDVATVATATAGLLAFSGAAVGGTAFAIYKESYIGLGIFWLLMFGAVALAAVNYTSGDINRN